MDLFYSWRPTLLLEQPGYSVCRHASWAPLCLPPLSPLAYSALCVCVSACSCLLGFFTRGPIWPPRRNSKPRVGKACTASLNARACAAPVQCCTTDARFNVVEIKLECTAEASSCHTTADAVPPLFEATCGLKCTDKTWFQINIRLGQSPRGIGRYLRGHVSEYIGGSNLIT